MQGYPRTMKTLRYGDFPSTGYMKMQLVKKIQIEPGNHTKPLGLGDLGRLMLRWMAVLPASVRAFSQNGGSFLRDSDGFPASRSRGPSSSRPMLQNKDNKPKTCTAILLLHIALIALPRKNAPKPKPTRHTSVAIGLMSRSCSSLKG